MVLIVQTVEELPYNEYILLVCVGDETASSKGLRMSLGLIERSRVQRFF